MTMTTEPSAPPAYENLAYFDNEHPPTYEQAVAGDFVSRQNVTSSMLTIQPSEQENIRFGPFSTDIYCQSCHKAITTTVITRPSPLAWFTCMFLALSGFYCLSCLPLMSPSCREAVHHCPECKQQIGIFKNC